MKRILRSLSIVLALCLGPYALAQTESGTISGRVVDASGSAVPNAEVRLTNQATGINQRASTESSGNFVFTNVLPGAYTVSVTAPGFKLFQEKGLTLTASERLATGALTLEVGSLTRIFHRTSRPSPVNEVK
jgi:Carboxypeptidase regulatory-like domain